MFCQIRFELLCCSVRRDFYFAWLLLAFLPLWRCDNVHLWTQSVPRFYLFLFLTLHTLSINIWLLLFYPKSLHLGYLCLRIKALGIKHFAPKVATKNCVSKASLLQWSLWRQIFAYAYSPTDSVRFPTEQPICLEIFGEREPTWEITPVTPKLSTLLPKHQML